MTNVVDERSGGALTGVSSIEMRQALRSLFAYAAEFVAAAVARDRSTTPRVVLVSRRLSCVYTMMCDDGEIDPLDDSAPCDVVFDRVVEQAPRWGAHDPVLLMDDVMIYGETLRGRYDEIVNAGVDPERVEVRVAAIRAGASETIVQNLQLQSAAPAPLDPATANRFSEDIAACLYRSQTPYFTDFPMSGPLFLNGDELARLLSTERWIAADVTLPTALEGQRAYSFLPLADVDEAVRQRAVPNALRLASFVKVRLFVDPAGGDGKHRVRVVPIGVVSAATPSQLHAAIDQIRQVTRQGLAWETWTKAAWHRLVQMYLSAIVLSEFWDDLTSATETIRPLAVDDMDLRHVRSYFGELDDKISHAFADVIADRSDKSDLSNHDDDFYPVTARSEPFRFLPMRRELAKRGYFGTIARRIQGLAPPRRPERGGEVISVSQLWAQMLLHTWALIVQHYQQPARSAMSVDGGSDAARERYAITRQGFTVEELVGSLLPWLTETDDRTDASWAMAVTSLVLDIGNDLGVVVPSTRDEVEAGTGSIVYRHYRAGENAAAVATNIWALPADSAAALRTFDPFLRAVFDVESDRWDDLPDTTRRRVEEFVRTTSTGEASDIVITTGDLLDAWDLTIEATDTDSVFTSGISLSDDITHDELRFDRSRLPETIPLDIGTRLMWYSFGPSESCRGPSDRFVPMQLDEPLDCSSAC